MERLAPHLVPIYCPFDIGDELGRRLERAEFSFTPPSAPKDERQRAPMRRTNKPMAPAADEASHAARA